MLPRGRRSTGKLVYLGLGCRSEPRVPESLRQRLCFLEQRPRPLQRRPLGGRCGKVARVTHTEEEQQEGQRAQAGPHEEQ